MEDYSANLLETITYFYTKAAQENKFKETEQKLIEFTRCEEAWEGCFFMLNQPDLNDYQMIFAANTLKSKMMFEFDNFKNNHPEEAARFGEEIIKMIKEFINNRSSRPNEVVINSLCLSLAFFSIHQDALPDIDSELCSNVDEV